MVWGQHVSTRGGSRALDPRPCSVVLTRCPPLLAPLHFPCGGMEKLRLCVGQIPWGAPAAKAQAASGSSYSPRQERPP